MKAKCKNCSIDFSYQPSCSKGYFCSIKCRVEYWRKHPKHHPRFLKDFNEKKVVKLYKEGKGTGEIASMMGYKQITVQKRLKKLGMLRGTKEEGKYRRIRQRSEIKIPKPSEDYAWFLGVMCGDGWTVKDIRIGLNVRDKDFLMRFNNVVEKLFGLKGKFSKRGGHQVIYHSFNLVNYLDNGFHGDTWHKDLHNPKFDFVLKNKRYFFAFLSGFFDSEGSAFLGKINRPTIQFAQTNEEGLKLIQRKLLEYGINSKITYLKKPSDRFSKREISKENPLAKNIRIVRIKDAMMLSKLIKSSLKRKEDKLTELRNYKPKRSNN